MDGSDYEAVIDVSSRCGDDEAVADIAADELDGEYIVTNVRWGRRRTEASPCRGALTRA